MSIKSAILAWIFTFYVTISSGPMINRWITIKSDINSLCAHQKLQNLNATTSNVFGEIEDIRQQLFPGVVSFLVCILAVSFIFTIFTTCDDKPFVSTTLTPCDGKHSPTTCATCDCDGKHSPTTYATCDGNQSSTPLPICDEKPFSKSHLVFPVVFFVFFLILTGWSVLLYLRMLDVQMDHCKTDLHDLHDKMISSLKENFGSDNFTIGTNISFEWNNLFIDYECCGVNRVVGTTNDFDNTSWCTTSGSCQATASQIPKTCCKGVTKYDYQSAPNDCHSSVSPGHYYEKGCYSVIKKELIKEQIQFDTVVDYLLSEWFKVVLAIGFCSVVCLCGIFYSIKLCCDAKGCSCSKQQNAPSNKSDVPITNKGTPQINNKTTFTPL